MKISLTILIASALGFANAGARKGHKKAPGNCTPSTVTVTVTSTELCSTAAAMTSCPTTLCATQLPPGKASMSSITSPTSGLEKAPPGSPLIPNSSAPLPVLPAGTLAPPIAPSSEDTTSTITHLVTLSVGGRMGNSTTPQIITPPVIGSAQALGMSAAAGAMAAAFLLIL